MSNDLLIFSLKEEQDPTSGPTLKTGGASRFGLSAAALSHPGSRQGVAGPERTPLRSSERTVDELWIEQFARLVDS